MTSFFELATSRDMFEKAKRERLRMQQSLNADTVFNFFVTAHHISDYVKESGAVPCKVVDAFLRDPDLEIAGDVCNKGKHFKLRKGDPETGVWTGLLGGAPLGALPLGSGEVYVLFVDDHSRAIDVDWLASRVLEKWEQFLNEHGL